MEAIITFVIAIIAIVAHIIKSVRESANMRQAKTVKKEEGELDFDDELIFITSPKPGKQKQNKPLRVGKRSVGPSPFSAPLSNAEHNSPKRQALSRKLSPQGEGQRFSADPGTLDADKIVAPTIDPTVKPELESITGIYEDGAPFAEQSRSAITFNLADFLAKPEGMVQAVIFAEILNQPAWNKSEGCVNPQLRIWA